MAALEAREALAVSVGLAALTGCMVQESHPVVAFTAINPDLVIWEDQVGQAVRVGQAAVGQEEWSRAYIAFLNRAA